MSEIPETKLPIEKEFLHLSFCQMVDTVYDLDALKKLTKELHLAYVTHQDVTNMLLKQKISGGL